MVALGLADVVESGQLYTYKLQIAMYDISKF